MAAVAQAMARREGEGRAAQLSGAVSVLAPLIARDRRAGALLFRTGLTALEEALRPRPGDSGADAREALLDVAIAAFRALLVADPGDVRARLELARAFFLKGEDRLARRHFETVLAGDIPEAAAANVQRFLAAIRGRKRWHVRFNLGLAPDSNIGASSGERTIMLDTPWWLRGPNCAGTRCPFRLNDPAREESGVGLSVRVGGEYQHPLSRAWRMRAGGDLSRRDYRGVRFDGLTLSGHVGPRWLIDAHTEASLLLGVRRHRSGGKWQYREVGPRLEAQRRLNRQVTAHGGLSWSERRHVRSKLQDGPIKNLHAGLSLFTTPTLRLDLTGGLSRERPDAERARRNRNKGRWASLGASWALGRGFSVSGSATLRRTDFDGPQPPYTARNRKREDKTRTLRLSAYNRALTFWGFSPRLSVVRETRESNAQLHHYERTSGELQFVRLF